MMKRKLVYGMFLSVLLFIQMPMYVKADVEETRISDNSLTMNIGEVETLSMLGSNDDDFIRENYPWQWTTTNAKVAIVSSDGKVTAVGKGAAVIKASRWSMTYYCRVNVNKATLKLNKASGILYTDGNSVHQMQLRATATGASSSISWNSSDDSVARVGVTGMVTAVNEGTAVVSASANGLTSICKVTVYESEISLNQHSMQLGTKGVGSTGSLSTKVTGTNSKVTWSTSNKNIATVSNGKITGKNTGTAVITATANGLQDSCIVTVIKDGVAIDKESVDLYTGGTATGSVILKSNQKKNVMWISANPEIATVDETGKVTAQKAGQAVVTARYGTYMDTCIICVKQSDIVLNKNVIDLNTKGSNYCEQLTATVTGSSNKVTWKTSNSKVASVSNGKVTGKGTGIATITAIANGIYTTCTVNVTETSMSMVKAISLNADDTPTYRLTPNAKGLNEDIMWKSSNTGLATVDDSGLVTLLKQGKVIITASSSGVKATCTITITKPAITLSKYEACLFAGGNKGNSITVTPYVVGTSKTVLWSSTDDAVAKVNKGRITAVSAGEADIMASANGKTAICHVVVTAASVTLSDTSLELTKDYYHHTANLYATVVGTTQIVSWKSSNTQIVTVSRGVVTAKSAGSAVITATANGVSTTCNVVVADTSDEEPTISINMPSIILVKNSKKQNTYTLGTMVSGAVNKIIWTSSDVTVATVNSSGKVTAKGIGTAIITATANGVSATCEAVITENTITLDKTSIVLNAAETNTTDTLTATITGIYNGNPTWKSSNDKVAVVDYTGKVEAIGKGSATITASIGGISATCKVTVKQNSIKLNKTTEILYYGGSASSQTVLKATIVGTDSTPEWISSDEDVAMVSDTGIVTPMGAGECIIISRANGLQALCDVNVIANSLKLNKHEMTLNTVGSDTTETLLATASGKSTKVYWSTSDKNVVTVSNGTVTAKRAGTAVVKAYTNNGLNEECEVTVVTPTLEINSSLTLYTESKENEPKELSLSVVATGKADTIEWYNSNGDVASFTNGTVKAIKEGSTSITAVANGIQKICVVTVINNHIHASSEWIVDIEATCGEMGSQHRECMTCEELLEDVAIPATGHTEGDWNIDRESTCTETGEKHTVCTKCGATVNTIVTSATGHTESDWITDKDVTCMESGSRYKECITCHEHTQVEEVPATGHSFGSMIKYHANCTRDGYTEHFCDKCNYSYTDEYVEAYGHLDDGTKHTEIAATCTTSGLRYDECGRSQCSAIIRSERIPALRHAEGEWITKTPATCITGGEKYTMCSVCNKVLQTEEIPAIGHSMGEWYEKTAATCESAGTEERICTNAGCSYTENRSISALGHNYGDWIVDTEPSDEENGSKHKECSRCGKQITEEIEYVIPHKHSWVENTRTDSTCSSEGTIVYICDCGETYHESIAKVEHTPSDWIVDTNATCSEVGSKHKECTSCQTVLEEDTIPAIGHTENSNWITEREPTCKEAGEKHTECTVCHAPIRTESISATGHTYIDRVVAPTCLEQGYTVHTCTCGECYEDTYIDAIGHDEGLWIVKTEAALGIAGEEELKCTKCSEVLETREIPMILTDGTNTVYTININNNQTTNVIGYYDDSQAEEMLKLINKYRVDNGLSALDNSKSPINDYAEKRAVETSYVWDHICPNGASPKYGENIATSNMSTTTVQEIFDSWINSKGHRNNILKDTYSLTAIKVFYQRHVLSTGKEVYIPYWVECFR